MQTQVLASAVVGDWAEQLDLLLETSSSWRSRLGYPLAAPEGGESFLRRVGGTLVLARLRFDPPKRDDPSLFWSLRRRTPDLALVAVRWLLRRAGALRPRQRADELPADSEEEAITHVALQLWRGRDVWAEFRCC